MKCRKSATREQRIQEKGWLYSLIGAMRVTEVSSVWRKDFVVKQVRERDTFEMILDCCVKFPNLNLIIYKKQECVDDEINKE